MGVCNYQTRRKCSENTSVSGNDKYCNGKDIAFTDYLLDEKEVTAAIENYVFTNGRPITRSMLAWWMYQDEDQVLIDGAQKLEIEHIFARKRQENEKTLKDKNNLEKLGNKVLLEEGINIRASDYRFSDKIKYYKGFTTDSGKKKDATKDNELLTMANTMTDYTEQDIVDRTANIYQSFIMFVKRITCLSDVAGKENVYILITNRKTIERIVFAH